MQLKGKIGLEVALTSFEGYNSIVVSADVHGSVWASKLREGSYPAMDLYEPADGLVGRAVHDLRNPRRTQGAGGQLGS